jgi:beta-fructofuranosidase
MRPEFHFTAEQGWINDPHGITVRDGVYHVFYQYVPGSTVWSPNCHWGHAFGPDLMSLKELPVAIAPGDGDDGIWTGSLVVDDDGQVQAFYTATTQPDYGIGRIRRAAPTDRDLTSWTKGEVVAEAPAGLDLIVYRDPFVVRDPDAWRMFVGAGSADGTAMALSYCSNSLDEWTYEGVALQRSTHDRDPVWLGALWECPQFIEVDGCHAMVSSVWDADELHYAGYALGVYKTGKFDAQTWGRLTYGPSYYAPSFFRDAQGRPCLLFWMRGVHDLDAGWAGAHSVPYLLGSDGDRLTAIPHPAVERYRGNAVSDGFVAGLAADAVWSPQESDALVVTSSERQVIRVDVLPERLIAHVDGQDWEMPYTGGDIRLVVDAQTIEISCPSGVLGLVSHPLGGSLRVLAADAAVYPLVR